VETILVVAFYAFMVAHIATGAAGLVLVWVPIVSRKGGRDHRRYGHRFATLMLVTGAFAVGMALCSLAAPLPTHPHQTDAELTRGLFGWMMLYLAVLTLSLARHGIVSLRGQRLGRAVQDPWNWALQLACLAAAAWCAFRGTQLGQPIMQWIAVVGIASALTNFVYLLNPRPAPKDHLHEHIKSSVGAGISAYTAFLSVGLVRLFPEHAFNPAVWAVPTLTGVAIIVWHQTKVRRSFAARPRGSRVPAESSAGRSA